MVKRYLKKKADRFRGITKTTYPKGKLIVVSCQYLQDDLLLMRNPPVPKEEKSAFYDYLFKFLSDVCNLNFKGFSAKYIKAGNGKKYKYHNITWEDLERVGYCTRGLPSDLIEWEIFQISPLPAPSNEKKSHNGMRIYFYMRYDCMYLLALDPIHRLFPAPKRLGTSNK